MSKEDFEKLIKKGLMQKNKETIINLYLQIKFEKDIVEEQLAELKAENERLEKENSDMHTAVNQTITETLIIKEDNTRLRTCIDNRIFELQQQLKEKGEEIARYKKFLATRQLTNEEFSFGKIEELKSQIKEKDEHIKVLLENELDKTKRLLSANTKQVCDKIREKIKKYEGILFGYSGLGQYIFNLLDQIEKGEKV